MNRSKAVTAGRMLARLFLVAVLTVSSPPMTNGRLLQNAAINLMEIIDKDPQLALFTILLEEAGLDDDIDNGDISANNRLTIFGPVAKAFESVDEELLTYLLTDMRWNTHLQSLLAYHIVADKVALYLDETATNIMEKELTFTKSSTDGAVMVNGYAKVINSVGTKDRVVHTIDNILDPGWLNKNLQAVLEAESSRLSTLSSLVGRVDTIATLATSAAPYTLFAPTNSAFALSEVDLINNLDPLFVDNVVGYHMVPGIYSGGELTQLGSRPLTTVSGETLVITTDPFLQTTKVNGNLVLEADLLANNGVVHIVDGVLSTQKTAEIDPDDMELCEYNKFVEEALGKTLNVQCTCRISGKTVQLSCTEREGQQCMPKFGICDANVETQQCCSPFQRRCVYGQCRDSKKPERVKVGAAQGGATDRIRRNRNNKMDERSIPP